MLLNLSFIDLHEKEQQAIKILKQFEPPEGYYVAISGGKDSTVVHDLVLKASVKADFHYSVTNLDAPETIRFIKQYMPDVKFDYPPKTFWRLLLEKKMPPTRLMRWCCSELKERGGKDRVVVTGIRADESIKRRRRKFIEVCYKQRKRFVNPIFDWTSEDVWRYISKYNLAYNPLYDRGYKRVGCIGCPFASQKQREKEFEDYPGFEKLFRYFFNRLYEEVYKYRECNWKSGDDIFVWWLYGEENKEVSDDDVQILFFEV